MKEEVTIKEYVDSQMESMKVYVDSNFQLDRKAVDQYSKTNDEWKLLHNGLQRKMEDDRGLYVTKDMMDEQSKLLWSRMVQIVTIAGIIVGALITIYNTFIKK